METAKPILIIDGQGGGMGRTLITQLRAAGCTREILAVGANAAATAAMRKAGANAGATGENAVLVNAPRAAVIAGPLGIVLADSLLGECTAAMAAAVARSPAHKVLVPVSRCGVSVAGVEEEPLADYIADAVQRILALA